MGFIQENYWLPSISRHQIPESRVKSTSSLKKRLDKVSKTIANYRKTLEISTVKFLEGDVKGGDLHVIIEQLQQEIQRKREGLLQSERDLVSLPKDRSTARLKSKIGKMRYELAVLDRTATHLISTSADNRLALVYSLKKEVSAHVVKAMKNPKTAGYELLRGALKLIAAEKVAPISETPGELSLTLADEISLIQNKLSSVREGPLPISSNEERVKHKLLEGKITDKTGVKTKKRLERLLAKEIASLMLVVTDGREEELRGEITQQLVALRQHASEYFSELVSKEPFSAFISDGRVGSLKGLLAKRDNPKHHYIPLQERIGMVKVSTTERKKTIFRVGLLEASPNKAVKELASEVDRTAVDCLKVSGFLDDLSIGLATGEINARLIRQNLDMLKDLIGREKARLIYLQAELVTLGKTKGSQKLEHLIAQHSRLIESLQSKYQYLESLSTDRYSRAVLHRNAVDKGIEKLKKDKRGESAGTHIFEAWKRAEVLDVIKREVMIQSAEAEDAEKDSFAEQINEIDHLASVVKASLSSHDVVKRLALSSDAKKTMSTLMNVKSADKLQALMHRKSLTRHLREIVTKELTIALFYDQEADQENRLAAVESVLEKAEALGIKSDVLDFPEVRELLDRVEKLPLYQQVDTDGVPLFRKGISLGNQFYRSIEDAKKSPDEAGLHIAAAYYHVRQLTALKQQYKDSKIVNKLHLDCEKQIRSLAPKTDKKGRQKPHALLSWETRKRKKLVGQINDRVQVSEPKEAARRLRMILSKQFANYVLSVAPTDPVGLSKELREFLDNISINPTPGLSDLFLQGHQDVILEVCRYEIEAFDRAHKRLSHRRESAEIAAADSAFSHLPNFLRKLLASKLTSASPLGKEPEVIWDSTTPIGDQTQAERRGRIIDEIISTEKSFLAGIAHLTEPSFHLKKRGEQGSILKALHQQEALSKKEYRFLEDSLSQIRDQSQHLLQVIEQGKESRQAYAGLLEAFSEKEFDQYVQALRLYVPKYNEVVKILDKVKKKSEKSSKVMALLELYKEVSKQSALGSSTIMPVQRLPRLRMLIMDLIKRHEDGESVKLRLNEIRQRIDLGNAIINAATT